MFDIIAECVENKDKATGRRGGGRATGVGNLEPYRLRYDCVHNIGQRSLGSEGVQVTGN